MKTIKFLLKKKDNSELGYEGKLAFVPSSKVKAYCEQAKTEGWSIRELREKKHV